MRLRRGSKRLVEVRQDREVYVVELRREFRRGLRLIPNLLNPRPVRVSFFFLRGELVDLKWR